MPAGAGILPLLAICKSRGTNPFFSQIKMWLSVSSAARDFIIHTAVLYLQFIRQQISCTVSPSRMAWIIGVVRLAYNPYNGDTPYFPILDH
jgi:hypothetical protein